MVVIVVLDYLTLANYVLLDCSSPIHIGRIRPNGRLGCGQAQEVFKGVLRVPKRAESHDTIHPLRWRVRAPQK